MVKKKIMLTSELLMSANDYEPLSVKALYAEAIAKECVRPTEPDETKEKANGFATAPDQAEENLVIKKMRMLEFFLEKYLKVKKGEKMSLELYDLYASSHIFNQLERMKKGSDNELKDKIFDIQSDYADFEKMVNTEIFNLKQKKNDSLDRFMASISMVSDPENIQALSQKLTETATKLGEVENKE